MLCDEFEPDPLHGRLPGRAGAASARRSPTWRSSQRADLYLIAPASANTIAKLAHGLADNLLTTAALAADLPGRARARR